MGCGCGKAPAQPGAPQDAGAGAGPAAPTQSAGYTWRGPKAARQQQERKAAAVKADAK